MNETITKHRRLIFISALLLVDAGVVAAALRAAELVRFHALEASGRVPHVPHDRLLQMTVLAIAAFLPALWGLGLYEMRRGWKRLDLMFSVLVASALAGMAFLALSYLFKEFWYSRLMLWVFGILACCALIGVRLLVKRALVWCFDRGIGVLRLAIVGDSASARSLVARIHRNPHGGLRMVGQLVASEGGGAPRGAGRLEEALAALQGARPHICLFAEPIHGSEEMAHLLVKCQEEGIEIWVGTDLHRRFSPRMELKEVEAMPVITLGSLRLAPWERVMKRAVDVVGAAALLLAAAPFLLYAALRIRREIGSPLLFRQRRVGFQGRPFTILKLRAVAGRGETDTPFCGFLRTYSLDELPQLWNVLRGEMSLVGPRPEIPDRVRRYNVWNRRRLQVKPGITGLAQIAGVRGAHDFGTKSRFDVRYLENQSLMLDVAILLRTPLVVLGRRRAERAGRGLAAGAASRRLAVRARARRGAEGPVHLARLSAVEPGADAAERVEDGGRC